MVFGNFVSFREWDICIISFEIFDTDWPQNKFLEYRKNHKISDAWKFAVITLKVEQDGFSSE